MSSMITLQPMHPHHHSIGIAGATTMLLREVGHRPASSKGLDSQENGITWSRDHLKNDPRPRPRFGDIMERKQEISIFGKRTEKLLNAARSGNMRGWTLNSSPDTPLRIWNIRDDLSGLIITAYQHREHIRIIDDRLRDITVASIFRHAVSGSIMAVV